MKKCEEPFSVLASLSTTFYLPFLHQAPEMPPFMLEPLEGGGVVRDEGVAQQEVVPPQRRMRNESYLGAINKDIHIRAGLQVHLNCNYKTSKS